MKSRRWQKNILNHYIFLFFVISLLSTLSAFAGPSRTTYQAKIIKPDGYPLEAAIVNFKFTMLDPSGSCMLYAETFSGVNMGSTAGLVSFSLGSGVRTFPVSGSTFEQVFSNTTASLTCDAGGPGTYSPLSTDTRKIVMQFNDGGGWQTLPAMTINAVPYAMYSNDSLKFNGKEITEFVQVASLPTCTASQAMSFNGVGFSCITAGGSGSVSSSAVVAALGYTPADSASLTTIVNNVSSVSSSVFTVAGSVTSLQSSVAASFAAITSSQWLSSGTSIYFDSGYVGIGTSAPAAMLEINSPVSSAFLTQLKVSDGDTGGYFSVSEGSSGITRYLPTFEYSSASVSGYGGVLIGKIPTAYDLLVSNGAAVVLDGRTASNTILTNANLFSVRNYGSVKFIVQASGTVGIGTNSPVTKLDVAGGIRIGTEAAVCAVGYAGTLRYNSGAVEYCNGTSWVAFGVSGAGILAINGLTSGSQTFAIGATGTAPNVSSTGTVHTFNFPFASAATTTAGLISYSDFANFNNKQAATSAAVIATLGYTPANTVSVTTLSSTVASLSNSVAASFTTITSSQWINSGSTIYYNDGNVGVGTSSPEMLQGKSLHLYTDLNDGTVNSNAIVIAQSVNRNAYFMALSNGTSNSVGGIVFRHDLTSNTTDGGEIVYNHSTKSMAFKTSGTEVVRITSGGAVGIGTTAPSAKLHLHAGTSSLAPFKFSSGTFLTSPASGAVEYDGFNYYVTDGAGVRRAIATETNPGLLDNTSEIANTGNISLTPTGSVIVSSTTASTNSQTGALVVKGGLGVAGNIYASGVIITSSNIQGSEVIATSATITPYIYGSTASGGSLRIESTTHASKGNIALAAVSGNVGIGVLGPSSKLQVSGLGNGANGLLYLNSNSPSARGALVRMGPYAYLNTDSPGALFWNWGARYDGEADQWVRTYTSGNNYLPYLKVSTANKVSIGGALSNLTTNANPSFADLFTVDVSSGYVGIGTTTPGNRLAISGNATSVGEFIDNSNSNGYAVLRLNSGNGDNPVGGALHSMGSAYPGTGPYTTSTTVLSGFDSGGLAFTAENSSGMIRMFTGGSINSNERLRITSSGNVGIGTATPAQTAEIDGSWGFNNSAPQTSGTTQKGILRLGANSGANGEVLDFGFNVNAASGYAWLQATNRTNLGVNYNMALNPNGGNVGIGTSMPAARLEITSPVDTSTALYIGNSASTGTTGLYFSRWGSASAPMGIQGTIAGIGANPIVLQAQAGNVGIGTTDPQATLHVSGTARIADGTQAAGRVLASDASGNASWKQAIIHGTINSVANSSPSGGVHASSGVSITLPPGKWQISGMGITSAASCRADFGVKAQGGAVVKYTLMPEATGDFQTATIVAYVDIASTTTYELFIASRGACTSQIHVDNNLWDLIATGVAY